MSRTNFKYIMAGSIVGAMSNHIIHYIAEENPPPVKNTLIHLIEGAAVGACAVIAVSNINSFTIRASTFWFGMVMSGLDD